VKRRAMLVAAAGLTCYAFTKIIQETRANERLAGKVVLITGSSRGFGLALAEEFGRHGAKLVLTARNREELLRAERQLLRRKIVKSEAAILAIPCDLTNDAQTRAMIATATERFGQIDALVNNAGVIAVGPIENQPLSAFKEAVESNYYSTLHATLGVLPQMLERGAGSIVNITSIGGKVAVPHLLPYSASKFAAVGFSQGLNAEVRSKGIRVTTVCPGLMRTGSHLQALFAGDREREYRWFSLGASLPGASIRARAAARKVVHATVMGTSEITITPQAIAAAKLAQLAPGITAVLLGLVNSFLLPAPSEGANEPMVVGHSVREKELSPLTAVGEAATYRWNERAGKDLS
jgi:NAD(P)-dependent dehydrogenase (short-subunit alcohol dehydrogenase family)